MKPEPIACNLSAFDSEEWEHYHQVLKELGRATRETRELDAGYAFRLPPDARMIRMAADFIALERRCCPFLAFSLVVEGEAGVWLHFTGGEGVKAFLKAELPKLVARADENVSSGKPTVSALPSS